MNRKTMIFLWLVIVCLFTTTVLADVKKVVINEDAFLHSLPLTVTRNAVIFKGSDNLYLIDVDKESFSLLAPPSSDKYVKSSYSISPDNSKLAVVMFKRSANVNIYNNSLTLIDLNSMKQRHVQSGIIDFCWSPKGDGLVYITGTYQDDFPGFKSDGVWIYNLEVDENTKIFSSGRRVSWSNYDGNIYITDYYTVHRYVVQSQEMEKTDLKGIYFSPDCKYYASGPHETESSVIYYRDKNTKDEVINQSLKEALGYFYYRSWLPEHNYLLVSGGQYVNIVMDVYKNKIINRFEGDLLGIDWQGKHALIQEIVKDKKDKRINRDSIKVIDLY